MTCDAGAECRVGKWWGENIFGQYTSRFRPRQDEVPNVFQVQWHVHRNWLIEASRAETTGGDVFWRKRW